MEMGENNSNNSNSNSDTNKKPKEDDDPNTVYIKVVDQKGGECCLRVKKTVKFGKVMDIYYERNPQVNKPTTHFVFADKRALRWHTLADLDIQNGDVIEVVSQAHGGRGGGGDSVTTQKGCC